MRGTPPLAKVYSSEVLIVKLSNYIHIFAVLNKVDKIGQNQNLFLGVGKYGIILYLIWQKIIYCQFSALGCYYEPKFSKTMSDLLGKNKRQFFFE